MVELINVYTGCKMYVDEARREAYLALGHKLSADAPKPKTVRKKPVKKEDK